MVNVLIPRRDGGNHRHRRLRRLPALAPRDYVRGRRLTTDEVVAIEALREAAPAAKLRIAVEGNEIARTTVNEPGEMLTAIATVFRTSQVSREYRQLAKLLPAGHDSRLRAVQRRAGSLLATPVMQAKERRWLDRSPAPAPDQAPAHPPAAAA